MWPTLHNIMAVAGWWDYAFIGCTACLVGIRLLKKKWPLAARLDTLIETRTAKNRRPSRLIPITFAAIVLTLVIVEYGHPMYPTITEHNVAIYGLLPNGDWAMSSDESGKFPFRPCPSDGAATTNQLNAGIGYVAYRATWEERGNCRSLNGPGLNFYWDKGNNDYRRISNARTADALHQ